MNAAAPWSKRTLRVGGVPAAMIASSRPQRASLATPGTCTWWVDSVSLGNVARSTTSTFSPARASSSAVADARDPGSHDDHVVHRNLLSPAQEGARRRQKPPDAALGGS